MATAPKSEILQIAELVSYQDGSVVSRQITKADAGNVTLFAFDQDQELSEHTAPFDALVHILAGIILLGLLGLIVHYLFGHHIIRNLRRLSRMIRQEEAENGAEPPKF